MASEVRWEHMFLDELEDAFRKRPIVFLPYGLCEPHGPQNALGCDGLRAHAICCEAARQFGGIVAPVFYWHLHHYGDYSAWAHKAVGQVEQAWLTPIPPWMFFHNICYHLRAIDVLGFHAAVLFSGHGGPHDHDMSPFVDLVQPHLGVRVAFVGNDDDLSDDPETDMEWADHAGKGETSVLWAAEPSCTDTSRLPPRSTSGPHFAMGANAFEANRRQGEWLIQHKADYLGTTAQLLSNQYDADKAAPRLTTYHAVETLWQHVVLPALPDFACMKERDTEVPKDSVWYPNWHIPHDGVH